MRGVMLCTNRVPEVPSEQTPWPSSISPAPMAAQALSPPPATTGDAGGQAGQGRGRGRDPAGDLGALEHLRAAGLPAPRGRPASRRCSARRRRSRNSVPDASAASVACSPVSRKRMKSLGSTSLATRGRGVGLVPAQPQQLGRLEARAGAVAGDRDHPLAAEPRARSRRIRRACGHRSTAGPGGSGRRRGRGTPSRASGPTGPPRRWPGLALRRTARCSTVDRRLPPGFRLLLGPARARRQQRIGRRMARARTRAGRREERRPWRRWCRCRCRWSPAAGSCVLFSSPVGSGRPDFTRDGPSSIACDRFAAAAAADIPPRDCDPLCPLPIPRATPSSISPCPRAGWRRASCACSTTPASG